MQITNFFNLLLTFLCLYCQRLKLTNFHLNLSISVWVTYRLFLIKLLISFGLSTPIWAPAFIWFFFKIYQLLLLLPTFICLSYLCLDSIISHMNLSTSICEKCTCFSPIKLPTSFDLLPFEMFTNIYLIYLLNLSTFLFNFRL